MKRFWVSLLTVLIYALAQFLPGMLLRSGLIHPEKGMETTQFMIYTQVSLFIIAAILIILINLYIKILLDWKQVIKNLNDTSSVGHYLDFVSSWYIKLL